MKQILFQILILAVVFSAKAQDNIYPTPKQSGSTLISNATVHVGNGQVLENASVLITDGKIAAVGTNVTAPSGATTINAQGKQLYPGLILSNTNLGLVEVPAVRATNDVQELGELNPNVRSIVAYNTDSKIINVLRANGILLASIVPEGGIISGSSSVVQLDAWSWEDAAYKTDAGIHFNMPSLLPRPRVLASAGGAPQPDPVKQGLEQIDRMKAFFRQAEAFNSSADHATQNLKFNAVKGLFDKSKKLFVHANTVKQMLIALDFVKEFNFDVVIVGGADSWQIADLLKQNNVAVILSQPHALPLLPDDAVDQPYKTAAQLQKAGVLFAINDDDGQTRGRNLPFNAGTAVTYGLSKEEALQAISLNAAKIIGVGDRTGSIEVGKDANILISSGDLLDMRTSHITDAFIQGRKINLDNKQKQLAERYDEKYNITTPF